MLSFPLEGGVALEKFPSKAVVMFENAFFIVLICKLFEFLLHIVNEVMRLLFLFNAFFVHI